MFRCLFVVTFQNIDQTSERGTVDGDGDVNIVNRADIWPCNVKTVSSVSHQESVITSNNPHPPLGHVCVSE